MPVVRGVLFTPAAHAELIEAQDWYEAEVPGLGRDFRVQVDAAVRRMAENPFQFAVVFKNVRRALLRRFPYMLFFKIEADTLFVIACFHASREPLQWKRRA